MITYTPTGAHIGEALIENTPSGAGLFQAIGGHYASPAQAIDDIVDNAISAIIKDRRARGCSGGCDEVIVRVEEGGAYVDISVCDNGCGIAAPQVGVLKRIIVIDCDQEDGRQDPITLINPEILELKGELVTEEEGCLSCPGISVPECRREYAVVKFTVSVGVPDEVFEIVPMHHGQIVFTHVREH